MTVNSFHFHNALKQDREKCSENLIYMLFQKTRNCGCHIYDSSAHSFTESEQCLIKKRKQIFLYGLILHNVYLNAFHKTTLLTVGI